MPSLMKEPAESTGKNHSDEWVAGNASPAVATLYPVLMPDVYEAAS